MFIEWIKLGKPTPASGSVGPMGAIVIGLVAGLVCFWAATALKQKLGYDDSLDVFGVPTCIKHWNS